MEAGRARAGPRGDCDAKRLYVLIFAYHCAKIFFINNRNLGRFDRRDRFSFGRDQFEVTIAGL
jgi:hypothetical protein